MGKTRISIFFISNRTRRYFGFWKIYVPSFRSFLSTVSINCSNCATFAGSYYETIRDRETGNFSTSKHIVFCPFLSTKFYCYDYILQGDNVTIMCFLKNEFTKFGNTWLDSNMQLVKMDRNVYWEDLHRGGSVLYVKNITVRHLKNSFFSVY